MNGYEYDETLWMTPSEKLEKFMSAKHSTARGDAEVNDDNTEHDGWKKCPNTHAPTKLNTTMIDSRR